MGRVIVHPNKAGTSLERVSDDDIGKTETNSVIMKHRGDSADPPEVSYWECEDPGSGSRERGEWRRSEMKDR